jgi:hypothetical protein
MSRRDAARRFASVVPYRFPRLISTKYGTLCRRRNAYRRFSRRGFVCVMSYVCHRSRIVEYYRKIIPQPKIFNETRTQDSFRVCDLSSCNLLSETNKFCLDAVLLLCLVLKLHRTSWSGLEPKTVFGVVSFVSIISSSKQTTLVLAPFFSRA